jgi:hypothetical protein
MRRVCLSDLHLGDDRSILADVRNVRSFVDSLAENVRRWDGLQWTMPATIDTLVLCGDIWEESVPSDLDHFENSYSRSVLEASRNFFGYLFKSIDVKKIVWVPGNHDLSLWKSMQGGSPASVVTPYEGEQLSATTWTASVFRDLLFRQLLPPDRLWVSYPIFRDVSAGDDYPMLLFTHGHLLDPFVRGLNNYSSYAVLSALGVPRPFMPPLDMATSMEKIANLTDPFTLALWSRYSRRDYLYNNYVLRRLEHPQSCFWPSATSKGSLCGPLLEGGDPPLPGSGLVGELPWFLQMAIMDPGLPTPVGSLRPTNQAPAFEQPSCLVHGHDHLGTSRTVVSCGVPFHVVDAGGWTSEFAGHVPHSHVLVWRGDGVAPESYYFNPPFPVGAST